MKDFEFFWWESFLILALVFVLLSFGHFFREVWNVLGFLPKLIFSVLLGIGFITFGYVVKERVLMFGDMGALYKSLMAFIMGVSLFIIGYFYNYKVKSNERVE